jgi:hypothetical protein
LEGRIAGGRLLKGEDEWLKGGLLKGKELKRNCQRRIAKGEVLTSLRAEILRKLKRTWDSASLEAKKTLREIMLKKS